MMRHPNPQRIGNEPEVEDEVDLLVTDRPANHLAAGVRADYDAQEGDGSLADETAKKARSICSARCRLSFVVAACFCVVILLIVAVSLGMELQSFAKQYLFRPKKNDDAPPAPEKPAKVNPSSKVHLNIGLEPFGKVKGTNAITPSMDTKGTLMSSNLQCKPTAIRGEHIELHKNPQSPKCHPLELEFDGDQSMTRRDYRKFKYVSRTQYCTGFKGAEPGNWLYYYHESIVAWAVLHPVRARANESIFLDIGANAGAFSALAASEGFEVYSFEPQPMCADNVLYMKQKNHIRRWKVFNVGLGCRADKLMVFGKECGMNWQNDPYVGIDPRNGQEFPRNYEVPQVPLSSFKIGHGTAPPFFKVDVDGGELEVAKAVLDLARNDKFPQLPEMYYEINPGYWPKLNGCALCDPCLGEPKGAGPNGCWGRLLNEGEQVFTALGALYSEIYLFGVNNGPCESRPGVQQYLKFHKTVSSGRGQYIYRVLDFPAVLAICVHQKIEDLNNGQMNVWFAA